MERSPVVKVLTNTPTVHDKYRRRNQIPTWLMILPLLIVMFSLVLFPIFSLLIKSLSRNNTLMMELFDSTMFHKTVWTFQNYIYVFSDTYSIRALIETFYIAILSVLISVVFGVPVAYFLTKSHSKFSHFARLIITLPIFVPDIVLLFSLVVFLGRQGIINFFLGLVGLHTQLIYNVTGVIIGTFYILFSPFVVIVAASMERLDWSLIEASYTLGESEFATFRRVILPLTSQGIFAGAILIFSSAVGFVTIAMVLGGGAASIHILPLEILNKISTFGADIPLAAAMAVILLVVTLMSQYIADQIRRSSKGLAE